MKILIIDSTNQQPVSRREAIADVLRRATKGDKSIEIKPIGGLDTFDKETDLRPDLLLLHASDGGIRDLLRGRGFVPLSELQYSEGGCVGGIPHSISSNKPITPEDAEAILRIIKEFPPEKRHEEFKKIWSGVPAVLVSWILWKDVLPEKVSVAFDDAEVAEAFNQLRSSLLLRSDVKGLPEKCPECTAPLLKDAKLLIELARVDL